MFSTVLTPLLNPGVHPPTPPSGPATTPPPDGTCGCPHITPLATSDKPDPNRAELEFTAADIDWTFSNRLARFDGDWQKALLDLAHAIDPDGSLQLWTEPAPAAAANAATLIEGDLTKFLISGPPDASTLPAAPYPLPGRDPRVAMQGFLYGSARISGVVMNLLTTIARSDKYGEPAFGVRDAALHWLRFLVEDLSRMPLGRARSSPAANRVSLVHGQALLTLEGIIEQAVRPDPRWRELPRFARIHSMLRHPNAPPITDAAPTGLALDIYDLASAALDVLLSIDRNKKVSGLTEFMGRPTHFDGYGIPVSDKDGPAEGAGSIFINRAIIELAALHSRFGGPAPSGSPAEAVACKTLSILMGLADRKLPRSAAFRRYIWAYMVGDEYYGAGSTTGRVFERRFRTLRAAALLAGLLDGQEALLYAPNILAHAELWYVSSREGPNAAEFLQAFVGAFQILRDINSYATGPGRAAFTKLVNDYFARVQRILAAVQAARDPVWPEVGQFVFFATGFPDPDKIPPIVDKNNRAALMNSLQQYLDLWSQSAPDISAAEWQALCPPTEAPPRVLIFAQGRYDPIMLDKLYQNIPLMLGVVFDEPYDGTSYPVTVRTSGGQIDLTARRVKENALLFLTDPFVVKGQ